MNGLLMFDSPSIPYQNINYNIHVTADDVVFPKDIFALSVVPSSSTYSSLLMLSSLWELRLTSYILNCLKRISLTLRNIHSL